MYASTQQPEGPPVSVSTLRKMREEGTPIACLTAYDASFAARVDAAGTDVVLVGDSLGMVVQGLDSTVPVTVDDVIYHCRATARGLQRALLMADMPFASYAMPEQAIRNGARLMQEGGAQMVKLEAGSLQAELVYFLTSRGIPVCGHIGLQPQFIHRLGGYRVQGRERDAAEAMLDDARALCEAGVDLLLLECVPAELARRIAEAVNVPVIGIGAGPDVDGQILVLYDVLGVTPGRKPRFAKDFMTDAGNIPDALSAYVAAVRDKTYPGPEHSF